MRKGWVVAFAGIWLSGLGCNLSAGAGPDPAAGVSAPSELTGEAIAFSTGASIQTPAADPEPPAETILCDDQAAGVALLVDPSLAGAVRANLDRFESDLCADGYRVIERRMDFAAPPEVRAYLADLYQRSGQALEGAIFIGDAPLAYQSVQAASSIPEAQPPPQEVISFQYYSDLDGEFSASPGYRSPGGRTFSFNQHAGEVDWEIWTAILPIYHGNPALTAEAVNRYFEKNHRFRTGGYSLPESFLLITEHYTAKTAQEESDYLAGLRSGQYSWTPLSNAPGARLYFSGPTLSVADGYEALSAGVADIAVTETHGDPARNGRIDVAWVESHPVRTALFWTDGCSVGNLDFPENFLTAAVYSPASEVLAAKGSTNDSGGLGTNREGYYGHNIAVRLAAGRNLGQAVLGHVNVPLIPPWSESREFHFSMLIIVGDPTLRYR
ncbi:MAG: hypothetical protein JW929_12185 [Anaerolineales bacterium]|nr:hypothetical protein [Anaerolineales bacterium]